MSRPEMFTAQRMAAVVALALMTACSTDRTTAPNATRVLPSAPSSAFDVGTATNMYVVKNGSTSGVSATRTTVAALGGRVVREIKPLNVMYVDGLSDAAAGQLAATAGVTMYRDRLVQMIPTPASFNAQFVSAVGGVKAQGTDQSGALFFNTYQWSLKVTRANLAWTPSNGGAGETVCVLDTGVDPGQQDLVGRVDLTRALSVIAVPRFASDLSVLDYHFHGTFVSAQVTSNGIGTASVAPNATLCALKVLSEDGSGTFGDILFGIYYAAVIGADVINMSLGGYIDVNDPNNAGLLYVLQEVIDFARSRGVLVVAAAGNGGFNMDDIKAKYGFIHVPSMMKNTMSVGATGPLAQTNFDALAPYSNYGGVGGLDLVAPGGAGGQAGGVLADYILSACSRFAFGGVCAAGNFYLFGNGTSFASPIVAGAAAVVESNLGTMPIGKLETCILSTTKGLYPGNVFGKGRLDVRSASLCSGK